MPWKKDALKFGVEMIKQDIEVVKEALIQIHEGKKKTKEQAETIKADKLKADIDGILEEHK